MKKIVKRNKMWTEKLNKACQGSRMIEVGRLITMLDSGFKCFAPNYSNYEWLPNAVAKADEEVIEAIKSDEEAVGRMNRWLSTSQEFYGELSDRVYVAEALRIPYKYEGDIRKLWTDTFTSHQPDIAEDTPFIIKHELMNIKHSIAWRSVTTKAQYLRTGSFNPKNYNMPDVSLRRILSDFERYEQGVHSGSMSHMMSNLKTAKSGVEQTIKLFKIMDRLLHSVLISSHEKIYITARKKYDNEEAYVYTIADPSTQRLPKHYRRYNVSEKRDAFGSDWGGLWLQDMNKLLSKAKIFVTKYTMNAEISNLENQQTRIKNDLKYEDSLLKNYLDDYEANTTDEAIQMRQVVDSFNAKILEMNPKNTPYRHQNMGVEGGFALRGSQALDNLSLSISHTRERIEKLNGRLQTVEEQLTAYGVISEEE
ncbi:MAG: hypothetical protein VW270_09235 [Candidatus Poseidoniales archaeon]